MGAVVSPYQVLSGQLAALLTQMHEQLHTELATAPDGVICTRVACHPERDLVAAGFSDGTVVGFQFSPSSLGRR